MDDIRDEFDKLFEGRIGPPPGTQGDVEALCKGGEERFKQKIPPGYMDAEKSKTPEEGKFSHRGLVYERRYGDLMLWRQLLAFAKDNKKATVMLITGDQKDDWWWREKGRTFGPKQDLVDEIHTFAGVETFWMYTPEMFLNSARDYTSVNVSQSSLDQLKEIRQDVLLSNLPSPQQSDELGTDSIRRLDPELLSSVQRWLIETQTVLTRPFSQGSPTLIGSNSAGLVGYQIFDARGKNPSSLDVQLLGSTIKLISAKRRLDLAEAHVICCGERTDSNLYGRIGKVIDEGEVTSVVVGELKNGKYVEVLRFTPS